MNPINMFHQRLHSFREAIAGSPRCHKSPEWLQQEVVVLIGQAHDFDPVVIEGLRKIKRELVSLNIYDTMERRVEIDQLACDLLNDQERRLRGQVV